MKWMSILRDPKSFLGGEAVTRLLSIRAVRKPTSALLPPLCPSCGCP